MIENESQSCPLNVMFVQNGICWIELVAMTDRLKSTHGSERDV